jgi:L-erythrulose 1-phosphate isomerase
MPTVPPRSKPWIGTSWKMNKTRSGAIEFAETLAAAAPGFVDRVNPFVLPPFPLIDPVARVLDGTRVAVGSQNVHWEEFGAFTGEVSAPMLVEIGARMTAIGHAERRRYFGETDQTVRAKAAAALRFGMTPLICVGESGEERETGSHVPFVVRQTLIALAGLSDEEVARTMLAYEPVWAIGVGSTPATTEQADEMHAVLRQTIVDEYGAAGELVPILYGGSVNLENAPDLAVAPHIDGLFVGRAAWDVDGYIRLAHIVAAG